MASEHRREMRGGSEADAEVLLRRCLWSRNQSAFFLTDFRDSLLAWEAELTDCGRADGPTSDENQDIYDGMGVQITENVFQGRNGTLFAYGQTSAGNSRVLARGRRSGPCLHACREDAHTYG